MGQGAQRFANVTVWVCEPILVPGVLGQAFVVLHTKSAGAAHVERIETFPSQRTLPVSTTVAAEGLASVLLVEVVTAADVKSFVENRGVRHFATVPVPLHQFVHLWQPAPPAWAPTSSSSSSAAHSTGPAECVWLGLDQDAPVPGSGVDSGVLFNQAKTLGMDLVTPKVGIMLRAGEPSASNDKGGKPATALAGTGAEASLVADPSREVFVQANAVVHGLHSHMKESLGTGSNYEALQAENVQLRIAIGKQREKYERLTTWLRSQVQEAVTGNPAAAPGVDDEMRRLQEKLAGYRGVANRLRFEIQDQSLREEGVQRHAAASRKAKEATTKLLTEKHAEVQQLGVQLQQGRRTISKLQRRYEKLQAMSEEAASAIIEEASIGDSPRSSKT
mmetsp:Transcript_142579/g.262096  ORF Transcript_142579/g.262096 Transcript_142579/m.262096 type:complete len:390 (+) Transcript_142579:71-1240(+)